MLTGYVAMFYDNAPSNRFFLSRSKAEQYLQKLPRNSRCIARILSVPIDFNNLELIDFVTKFKQ
jgi:hypothetical protein